MASILRNLPLLRSVSVCSWHFCLLNRLYSTVNLQRLHSRGLLVDVAPHSCPKLPKLLTHKPQTIYCGYDPSGSSLHIGHLLTIIALLHWQRAGHQVLIVIGDCTAKIGDPSSKRRNRKILNSDEIIENSRSIQSCLERILNNHKEFLSDNRSLIPPKIFNNLEWHGTQDMRFWQEIGPNFHVNNMLNHDGLKERIDGSGLSLTEFLYPVYQAYDWLHLSKQNNCFFQIGGTDQMDNMKAGQELIKNITGQTTYCFAVPLVNSLTGDKLGKTEGEPVFLNLDKTSIFEFYQHFIRLPDSEVERYLRLFTFLTETEILQTVSHHMAAPDRRKGQKRIAELVTILVHGRDNLKMALQCSEAVYNNSIDALLKLKEEDLKIAFSGSLFIELLLEPGISLLDLTLKAKCFRSSERAESIIRMGGLCINHRKMTNPYQILILGEHILPNSLTLIRVGKKNYYIVKWINI